MRARGVDIRGPNAGSLVAPSGSVRSWQTVTVGGDDLFSAAEPLPFLIQHDSSGVQHQRELAGADAITPHPNGAQRLQAVIVATANLSATEDAFARAYGLHATKSAMTVPVLAANALALPLQAIEERIVLAEPLSAGIVNDRLPSAGEGICCVSVAVTDLAVTHSYLRQRGVPCAQWEDGLMVPASVTGGAPLAFVKDVAE